MSALAELIQYIEKDEVVESVIFGDWGWSGFSEPEPNPVPLDKRKKVLSFDEAKKYLKKFEFNGGYGHPSTYAVRIFTNKRIIWVTQYDGSTGLDSTIRNPEDGYDPSMPGG